MNDEPNTTAWEVGDLVIHDDIYTSAVDTWGVRIQTDIFIEEAAEAIQAISHHRRGRCDLDAVCGELADVWIMLSQMRIVYGKARFDKIFAEKLVSLKTKLDKVDGHLQQRRTTKTKQ